MKRPVRIAAILLLLGILAWFLWAYRGGFFSGARQPSTSTSTLDQAITHPVVFAENHFKGGIGVMLTMDPQSGSPKVVQVVNGSPAEKAGLSKGDVIARINGTAMAGKPLAQIVDELRGFVGGQVRLTVQRAGSTNLEMTLHRSSWSGLGISYSTSSSNGPAFAIPSAAVTSASNGPSR